MATRMVAANSVAKKVAFKSVLCTESSQSTVAKAYLDTKELRSNLSALPEADRGPKGIIILFAVISLVMLATLSLASCGIVAARPRIKHYRSKAIVHSQHI